MKFFERGTYTTFEVDRALKFDYMKLKTFSALAKGVKFKKKSPKICTDLQFLIFLKKLLFTPQE